MRYPPLLPLLAALAATACFSPVAPDLPPMIPAAAERVNAPPAAATWWEEARACVGRRGDVGRLEFWVVDGFINYPQVTALWLAPHAIYVRRFYRDSREVVEHEMLHDLLQEGNTAHRTNPCFMRLGLLPQ